jgi:hypothetical protein
MANENEPVAVSAGFSGEGAAADAPPPRTPTPASYPTGSVKQDPASLAVAVRTNIPDPDSAHDWGVMTVDRGGHYSGYDDVVNWPDIAAPT